MNTVQDSPISAKGRFGRFSYLAWLFLLSIVLMIVVFVAAGSMTALLDPNAMESFSLPALIMMIVIYVVFIYFSIVFSIRRLHDRNHSGWFVLLMLVPAVNIALSIYLIFAKGTEGSNNFGPQRPTKGWEKVLAWIYILLIPLAIISLVYVGYSYDSVYNNQQLIIDEANQQLIINETTQP